MPFVVPFVVPCWEVRTGKKPVSVELVVRSLDGQLGNI